MTEITILPFFRKLEFSRVLQCNLSYIKEYEQKFRKYEILAKIDRVPEYLNKYILKIQGPVGVRLWNEFSTSEYKNSPYMGSRVEFVKKLVRKRMFEYRIKKSNKRTRFK